MAVAFFLAPTTACLRAASGYALPCSAVDQKFVRRRRFRVVWSLFWIAVCAATPVIFGITPLIIGVVFIAVFGLFVTDLVQALRIAKSLERAGKIEDQ